MFKLYEYAACSTCRKARAWLDERGIGYERLPIREQPPQAKELHVMLQAYQGELKRLINTSSADYRSSGLKERLPSLSTEELFQQLRENGNLIRRPFLIGQGVALVGFKEGEWKARLA